MYREYIKEDAAIKWYDKGKFSEDDSDVPDELPEPDKEGVGMLLGKTLKSVEVDGDRYIRFLTTEDEEFIMYHEQECCEHVHIEDIVGDTEDLVGSPILVAREDTGRDIPLRDYEESWTWTFYNIGTFKGHVTIRWYGSSNGYYSEKAEFRKIENGQPVYW